MDKADLYFSAGSSNKEYHVAIQPKGNGYVVEFSYGRVGSTLLTGSKTAKPVDLYEAREIFNKIVKEKTAKGYSPGKSGSAYQMTDKEQRKTDLYPQLLNEIFDDNELEAMLDDPNYFAQEKHDGKRIMLRREDGGPVVASNKKGLSVGIPSDIVNDAMSMGKNFILDGECIGEKYYIFDALHIGTSNISNKSYEDRMIALENRFRDTIGARNDSLVLVETAKTPKDKKNLLKRLKRDKAEGIVFKDKHAVATAGRPASRGPQRKYKFTATATCEVVKVNKTKRSVEVAVLDKWGEYRVNVGNVTIYPNFDVPSVGEYVEIKYLYFFKDGSLYQPVFLGVRDDADLDTVDKLKYKRENADEE